MTLPANWTAGQQFTASAENSVETAVNANTNARPANGTYASRPAAGNSGKLYFATDNNTMYQDNGSAWVKVRIGSDSCSAMGDVPTTGWTAVNMQSGASFTADKDAMLFTVPGSNSGAALWQYQYRTYPTPPFTLTAYIDVAWATINESPWGSAGIVTSDGTKIIGAGPQGNSNGTGSSQIGWNVWVGKFNNTTTYSTSYGSWPYNRFGATMPKWFRYTDDNTNVTWAASVNGIDWETMGTESRTSFLTPTRIGVGGTNGTASNILMRIRSWNGVA